LQRKMGNKASIEKLSKQVQEGEERIKKVISEKDDYFRALVLDKNNLEAAVLELTELKEISTKFHAERRAWDLEKDELLSRIAAEREERKEMFDQSERVTVQLRAENKKLEDELSSLATAKKLLQEENNSLKTELENRTFVSEEIQQSLESRKIRELETTLDVVQKNLHSFRACAMEKERTIVELQHKLSEFEEEKLLLLNDLNKQKMFSEKANSIMRRWQSSLESVNIELESEDDSGQRVDPLRENRNLKVTVERETLRRASEKRIQPKYVAQKTTQQTPIVQKQATKIPMRVNRALQKTVPDKRTSM